MTLNQLIKKLQELQDQGHGRKPVVQHGPRQSRPHHINFVGLDKHEFYGKYGHRPRNQTCVEIWANEDI